jgi:hypothetical protein
MKYIIALVLPLLFVTAAQIAHAKIELDCPKGTYLTSNLQCNPYPPQEHQTNQTAQNYPFTPTGIMDWLGDKIMSKIPNSTTSYKMGEKVGNLIVCFLTGYANKTICK